jgi:MinD superfamily P-loop ATPase
MTSSIYDKPKMTIEQYEEDKEFRAIMEKRINKVESDMKDNETKQAIIDSDQNINMNEIETIQNTNATLQTADADKFAKNFDTIGTLFKDFEKKQTTINNKVSREITTNGMRISNISGNLIVDSNDEEETQLEPENVNSI